MRVLGTTKRRTRIMLYPSNSYSPLGLVLAFIILSAINGNSILTVVLPLHIYIVLHFAGCIIDAHMRWCDKAQDTGASAGEGVETDN